METSRTLYFLGIIIFLATVFQNNGADRVKRKVVFNKNTKFFIRLNGKGNVLNATTIFSHGWAIRINYELPDSMSKMRNIFKRNVGLPQEENSFSTIASSCISKQICQSFNFPENNSTCGVICGVRKIIQESSGLQAEFLKSFLDNCNLYDTECPYDIVTNGLQELKDGFHI